MLPRITFSIERWKYNKTYEIYVSNKGHFRNREKQPLAVKIDDTKGYCRVWTGGSDPSFKLAHRVVMQTWKPTPESEFLTVDHLDHNKRNNALDNLEWVTKKENLRRAEEDLVKAPNKYEILGHIYNSAHEAALALYDVKGVKKLVDTEIHSGHVKSVKDFYEKVEEKLETHRKADSLKYFGHTIKIIHE